MARELSVPNTGSSLLEAPRPRPPRLVLELLLVALLTPALAALKGEGVEDMILFCAREDRPANRLIPIPVYWCGCDTTTERSVCDDFR